MCFDTDSKKFGLLQEGEVPIYEPGLQDTIRRKAMATIFCMPTQTTGVRVFPKTSRR